MFTHIHNVSYNGLKEKEKEKKRKTAAGNLSPGDGYILRESIPSVLSATITIAVYSTLIMRTWPGEPGCLVWGNTHVEVGALVVYLPRRW